MTGPPWLDFGRHPAEFPLPIPASAPGVCAGAELNSTVARVEGDRAHVSEALGDLRRPDARARFERALTDAADALGDRLAWIACDRHPAYASRAVARRLARRRGADLIEIQHHHAHLAACLADHGLAGPAVGLICDGVGYGEDGQAWGGECLVGDLTAYSRAGRLRPLPLPGGDRAATDAARCAAGWLFDALGEAALDHPLTRRLLPDDAERAIVARQLTSGLNCPASSGAGRLFDAAAAILGLCARNDEPAATGRAMEAAANRSRHSPAPPPDLCPVAERDGLLELDHRPLLGRLIRGIDAGEPPEDLAHLFHAALARGLFALARHTNRQNSDIIVINSGGVFCNALLANLTSEFLRDAGSATAQHRAVPPHDAGLSLGQAAIAAALSAERVPCASPPRRRSTTDSATTPGSPSDPPGSASASP